MASIMLGNRYRATTTKTARAAAPAAALAVHDAADGSYRSASAAGHHRHDEDDGYDGRDADRSAAASWTDDDDRTTWCIHQSWTAATSGLAPRSKRIIVGSRGWKDDVE
jgi:hypothetical protein